MKDIFAFFRLQLLSERHVPARYGCSGFGWQAANQNLEGILPQMV